MNLLTRGRVRTSKILVCYFALPLPAKSCHLSERSLYDFRYSLSGTRDFGVGFGDSLLHSCRRTSCCNFKNSERPGFSRRYFGWTRILEGTQRRWRDRCESIQGLLRNGIAQPGSWRKLECRGEEDSESGILEGRVILRYADCSSVGLGLISAILAS
jgi:hypothetical protein